MRKTKNLPWMGRTVATAIMVLIGLGVFAGSASAQGKTFYDFDNAAAWWDYFDCDAMRVILGTGGAGTAAVEKASESDACKGFSALPRATRRSLEDFIDSTMTGPYENTKTWWNMNAQDGDADQCVHRQQLVGVLPLDGTAGTDGIQLTQTEDSDGSNAQLYCRAYDGSGGLRAEELDMVDAVGMAVSGRGMMTEEEEAPALPLVGVGILGLLLAGRGAWLRRRNA